MDVARVARRLGAEDAVIIYRRTRKADDRPKKKETQEAEREGVRINWLRTITAFDRQEVQVEVMELDPSADAPARPAGSRPLAADTVIMALGQEDRIGVHANPARRALRRRRHQCRSRRR